MIKEYNERRKEDERKEVIATEFLENRILNRFPDYKRNFDIKTQKLGKDFEFTGKDGYHYICDLKAIFKSIPTACLECACRIKYNNVWNYIEGWFLNEKELTNTFVMFWLDDFSKELQTINDIHHCEAIFIKKENIWNFLRKQNWDKGQIYQKIKDIKLSPQDYFKTKWYDDIGFNCPINYYNEERPINLLLKRNIYRQLSSFIFKE